MAAMLAAALFVSCTQGLAGAKLRKVRLQWSQEQSAWIRILDTSGKCLLNQWRGPGAHDTVLTSTCPLEDLRGATLTFSFEVLSRVGSFGNVDGFLVSPEGICWNTLDGLRSRWAVADPGNRRVVWVDSGGRIETWIADEGRLLRPVDVVLGPFRDVWICDAGARKLFHYDYRGAFLGEIAAWGPGNLQRPVSLKLDSYGKLLVLDQAADCLFKIDPVSRQTIREYCALGWGLGFLRSPSALSVSDDAWYLVDAGNDRVIRFAANGAKASAFPIRDAAAVACIEDGLLAVHFKNLPGLWLVDQMGRRIMAIDEDIRSVGGISLTNNLLAVTEPGDSKIVFVRILKKEQKLVLNASLLP